jgi:hypothetical protein
MKAALSLVFIIIQLSGIYACATQLLSTHESLSHFLLSSSTALRSCFSLASSAILSVESRSNSS